MLKLFRGTILGAPAAGKGTISSKIVDTFNVIHVSTGDIFRQSIAGDSSLGRAVKKYTSQGKLVPDVLVNKVMLEKLSELTDQNILLDGYPRTLVQAEKLFMTFPLTVAINLVVPYEEIIERVKGRLVHVPSGRVYNTVFKPPKVEGVDDVTGEALVRRPDDEPDAVRQRLEIYSKMTEPLLQFYKRKGILKDFKGTSSDDIWLPIEEMLKNYFGTKS